MAVSNNPTINDSWHHLPIQLLQRKEWQDRSMLQIKPTAFMYPPRKPHSPSALQTFHLKMAFKDSVSGVWMQLLLGKWIEKISWLLRQELQAQNKVKEESQQSLYRPHHPQR
jgi:hypothetical protein